MKKLLAMLLSVALCIPVIAVAGCSREKTLSLLDGKWVRYETDGVPEEVYTITQAEGEPMKASYDGLMDWKLIKHSMAVYEADQLKDFKKVVFEGKLTSNAQEPKFMLKFDFMAGYEAQEVMITPTSGEAGRYEWDISWFHIDKAMNFMIFCDPGSTAKGELEVTKLELSNKEVDKQYKIGRDAPYINMITDADPSVMKGWFDNTFNDVYNIEENADGTVKVTKLKDENWLAVGVYFSGEALKNMKSFKIVVNGDIKTFKVESKDNELFNAVELPRDQQPVNGDNEIVIGLNDMTAIDANRNFKLLLLFNWDNYAEGINFTIKSAAFSTQPKA